MENITLSTCVTHPITKNIKVVEPFVEWNIRSKDFILQFGDCFDSYYRVGENK
jgi:hypothetical protein